MTRLGALTLALPLTLVACGGGSETPSEMTDAGYAALGAGDHTAAVESFEGALASLEPGSPDYLRAKMGEIEALIHVDAARARDEFLSESEAFGEAQYATVGSKMTSAKKFNEAIAVLDAGMKRFSESPKLKAMLDQVALEAQKSGNSDALDALKGLGYL